MKEFYDTTLGRTVREETEPERLRREEDNALCDKVYAWCKGNGPEPYAPYVGATLKLVCDVRDAERARWRGVLQAIRDQHPRDRGFTEELAAADRLLGMYPE